MNKLNLIAKKLDLTKLKSIKSLSNMHFLIQAAKLPDIFLMEDKPVIHWFLLWLFSKLGLFFSFLMILSSGLILRDTIESYVYLLPDIDMQTQVKNWVGSSLIFELGYLGVVILLFLFFALLLYPKELNEQQIADYDLKQESDILTEQNKKKTWKNIISIIQQNNAAR